MTLSPVFEVRHYKSHSGPDLVNYVEPFLAGQGVVPESIYGELVLGLADLDNEHAIYAIDICGLLKPCEFVPHLLNYLTHSDSSVCCAAFRQLNRLPLSAFTAETWAKIRSIPIVDLFDPSFNKNQKLYVGTNQVFVQRLIDKQSECI